MNSLFCLVSRQPMANTIPVLKYMPPKVLLFSTNEENKVADQLEKLFKSKNLWVKRINNLDAYDYHSFRRNISRQLSQLENAAWLNLTGGTKLMALAAYEIFTERNKNVIYCNTEKKQIIHLFPVYKTEAIDLAISIEDYLLAYGYNVISIKRELPEDKIKLFKLIEHTKCHDQFVMFSKKIRETIKLDEPQKSCCTIHWQYYKNYDKITIVHIKSKSKFTFEQKNFMHGIWLEEFAYYTLINNINHNFDDIAYDIKIQTIDGLENQIDVAFIRNSRLYLISCKSGIKDENSALYEIETLRQLTGGTYASGYNLITRIPSEIFVRRANELSIKLININELNKFSFI